MIFVSKTIIIKFVIINEIIAMRYSLLKMKYNEPMLFDFRSYKEKKIGKYNNDND